jgi:hypothetical protein
MFSAGQIGHVNMPENRCGVIFSLDLSADNTATNAKVGDSNPASKGLSTYESCWCSWVSTVKFQAAAACCAGVSLAVASRTGQAARTCSVRTICMWGLAV